MARHINFDDIRLHNIKIKSTDDEVYAMYVADRFLRRSFMITGNYYSPFIRQPIDELYNIRKYSIKISPILNFSVPVDNLVIERPCYITDLPCRKMSHRYDELYFKIQYISSVMYVEHIKRIYEDYVIEVTNHYNRITRYRREARNLLIKDVLSRRLCDDLVGHVFSYFQTSKRI